MDQAKQTDGFMNGYEDGFNACNDKGYEVPQISLN
jgi:hypothetical protein